MMLPILEIPRRRKFLTHRVGATVRELFARDQTRPLPPVEFFTADEARRAHRPPTSYYDFARGAVGLFYDETLDIDTLWATLVWHALHEMLHWALNFSPKQAGARDKTDCELLNVIADAANEQRAGLVSDWCRDSIRRGRRTVVERSLAEPLPSSPLWAAAWLSLRAHTLLASRGWRLLARAADPESGVSADTVWAAIEPDLGPPPATIAERWPEAWRLLWGAWRADNQHTVFASVRALRELFPESETDEPPAKGSAGPDEHPGSDSIRPDTPPGAEASRSGCDEETGAEVPESERDAVPGAGGDREDESGDVRPSPTPEELRAELDDGDADEQSVEPIKTEVAALLEDPRMWEPLRARRLHTLREYVEPRSGRRLLAAAEARAAELARTIEAIQKPSARREGTRGRVRARIVAREPAHPRPFRERVCEELALGPGVFVGAMLDTSGSMGITGRMEAAREAAMALALACDRTRTPFVTVTSRGLVHVAGDGMAPHRAAMLLEGLSPSGDEGFPWTLAPFLEAVSRRGEQVKIVVVVMDGMPVDADSLVPVIEEYRRRGLFVIGLGLDLNSHEAAGLVRLFGREAVLGTRAKFAGALAGVVSAAIARGVR
jgi:Mg-chelatase subunit ChlD